MSDWSIVLVSVYVGVSLVSHVLQYILWWRLRQDLATMDTAVAQGFNDARWEMLSRHYSIQNGTGQHE